MGARVDSENTDSCLFESRDIRGLGARTCLESRYWMEFGALNRLTDKPNIKPVKPLLIMYI